MTSEAVNVSVSETEESEPKSFFSRWGGVYFSPTETFREIGGSPRVLVPIIFLIIIGLVVGSILTTILDVEAMAISQIEQATAQGRMTAEQSEQTMPFITVVLKVQLVLMFAIGNLFAALIIAGFVKLFSAIVGAINRFKAVLSVTLFALIAVTVIHQVLLLLVVYLKGGADIDLMSLSFAVSSNLNSVLSALVGEDALPKYLMNLARYVDLFNIWLICLLAIGSAAVSRKLKTSTAAIWLGGAYAVMALIGAAASGSIPGM